MVLSAMITTFSPRGVVHMSCLSFHPAIFFWVTKYVDKSSSLIFIMFIHFGKIQIGSSAGRRYV